VPSSPIMHQKNLSLVNSLKEQVGRLELTENTMMLYGEIEAVLEKSVNILRQ
jgi:hypothetical protein